MGDKKDERRPGIPKYFYWGKKPPSPRPPQKTPTSRQQKSFSRIMTTFRVARVAAVVAMVLLILTRL